MTKQIAAGVRTKIKLRLNKRQLRAVKTVLAARRRLKLKVTVVATDAAGNAVTRTRTVKARR